MKKATLGKTGMEVSKICFGSLVCGPLQANLPPERAAQIMAYAFSRGVNMVDTAQYYQNYEHIRLALRAAGDGVIVSTKTYAYSRELAATALDQARRGLNRDVIDIFMLHEQESEHTIRGHMEALEYLHDAKAKGLVRAVGLSTHHVAGVLGAVRYHELMDVLHPIFNVEGLGIADGTREDMEAAVARAKELGIGVLAMKPFGGGNLFRRAGDCLSYALGSPLADSVAVGMQSEREVDANINFLENGAFAESDRAYITSRERRLHIEDWCEGCARCVGACASGALSVVDGRLRCDAARCVLCGYCGAKCVNMAIKVL